MDPELSAALTALAKALTDFTSVHIRAMTTVSAEAPACPDFDRGQQFHGGGWGGGWGPHPGPYYPPHPYGGGYQVNPWNFVAPVINQFIGGRWLPNPNQGGAEMWMRSPGQWVPSQPGMPTPYTWQPLATWPL